MLQWFSCFVIGITVGSTAAAIIHTSHEILELVYTASTDALARGENGLAFVYFMANGLLCAGIAASLTSVLEPLSGASGIPDVKSYLNGNFYPGLLRFRTLFCRVVGLTLSTASGLYVGKEGLSDAFFSLDGFFGIPSPYFDPSTRPCRAYRFHHSLRCHPGTLQIDEFFDGRDATFAERCPQGPRLIHQACSDTRS